MQRQQKHIEGTSRTHAVAGVPVLCSSCEKGKARKSKDLLLQGRVRRQREERLTRTNNASNLTHRRLRTLRASEQSTLRKASRSRGKSRSRRRSKAQSTTSYVVRRRSKARSTSTNSKQSMTPSKYSTTPKQSSLAAGRAYPVFCNKAQAPLCLFFSPVLPPVLWLVQVAGGGLVMRAPAL